MIFIDPLPVICFVLLTMSDDELNSLFLSGGCPLETIVQELKSTNNVPVQGSVTVILSPQLTGTAIEEEDESSSVATAPDTSTTDGNQRPNEQRRRRQTTDSVEPPHRQRSSTAVSQYPGSVTASTQQQDAPLPAGFLFFYFLFKQIGRETDGRFYQMGATF